MQSRIERANTDVVDVLFLVLKSYECTAHQLFRGKTDHDRIIERNKIRFCILVLISYTLGNQQNAKIVRRVDAFCSDYVQSKISIYIYWHKCWLYESLTFYIFRSVKTFGALIIVYVRAVHTNFSSDCSLSFAIPVYGDKVIKPSRYRKNRRFGSGEAGHSLLNTIENR